jgi:hypothetical protein
VESEHIAKKSRRDFAGPKVTGRIDEILQLFQKGTTDAVQYRNLSAYFLAKSANVLGLRPMSIV